jgi:cobalamin biosynthesis protein CbiD
MRFPVTALTTAGAATLDAAFDALAHGGEVGYEVQVRRIAGVDTAVPLDVLRATADSARASVRRILVALGSTISSEALALSASRPARRCA